jgi:RNA polymerase sigma-70 factor (ECF subfamily)
LVYGYLVRRTRDPTLAEELAQETFYRATRAFLGWRRGSAAAWLLAIARNVLADHVRKRRVVLPLTDEIAAADSVLGEAEAKDTLALLPPAQRRLLELVYIHGYSHAEIAAMEGSTAGAVKTAVYRARRSLGDVYEAPGEGGQTLEP